MANPDDQRGPPWIATQSPLAFVVVALLALFGIRSPQSPSGASKIEPISSSDAIDGAADTSSKIRQSDSNLPPWKLLFDYFRTSDSESHREDEPKDHVQWVMERLGITQAASALAKSDPKRSEATRMLGLADRVVPRMDCLIVTVADPIDSRFQHVFDASIDAIQRGLGSHGYDLDRFLFLWSEDLKSLAKAKQTSRDAISTLNRSRHVPNAMLFRRNLFAMDNAPSETWGLSGNTNSLLMVLLVGETPTTGVHKEALAKALDFVAACSFHPCHRQDETIGDSANPPVSFRAKILGPEFSGSAPSLRQGIVDWSTRRRMDPWSGSGVFEVDVVSGSATSGSTHSILNHVEHENNEPKVLIRYSSTVLPDSTTNLELLKHLVITRGISPDKIAMLSERGTVYGRAPTYPPGLNSNGTKNNERGHDENHAIVTGNLSIWHKSHGRITAPLSLDGEERHHQFDYARRKANGLLGRLESGKWHEHESLTMTGELSDVSWAHRLAFLAGRRAEFGDFLEDNRIEFADIARIRTLTYPLGLSRIRSEFEKSEAYRSESGRNGQVVAKRNVELKLGNVQHAIDTVPIYSDVTTPAIDITLERLLATIKRDDIRAVGLMGTDVLDKLFLAQHLRAHAPDVVLFTQEYDVFYMHADYARYLDGMVIASSYPFNPRGRGWSPLDPRYRDHVFPTDSAQGVYNATVALLNMQFANAPNHQPVKLLNFEPPFAMSKEGKTSTSQQGPSVWLTMVGETGLAPLDVIPIHDGKHFGAVAYTRRPASPPAPARKDSGQRSEGKPLFVRVPPFLPVFSLLFSVSLGLIVLFSVNGLSDRWRNGGLRRATLRFAPWLVLGDWSWKAGRGRRWRALRWRQYLRQRLWAPRSLRASFTAGLLLCAAAACILIASPRLVAFRFDWSASSRIMRVENSYGQWASLVLLLSLGIVVAATLLGIWRALSFAPAFAAWKGLTLSLGVIVSLIGCVVWLGANDTRAAVFMERAGNLTNGLSPLPPLLALLAALVCWCCCHLRREYFLRVYRLWNPFPIPVSTGHGEENGVASRGRGLGVNCAGVEHRFRELNAWLRGKPRLPQVAGDWVMGLVFTLWIIYVLVFKWTGSAEGWVFDLAYRLLLAVVVAAYFALLVRVRAVAGLFERLLRRLAQHPMVSAFGFVPARLASKVTGQFFAAAPHPGDLEFSVRCLKRLAHSGPKVDLGDCEAQLSKIFGRDRAHYVEALLSANQLQAELTRVSRHQLAGALETYWNQIEVRRLREKEQSGNGQAGQEGESKEADLRAWQEEAEVFVAMQWIGLIRQVFTHLQNLGVFLIAMLLCVLISLQVYPFQPRSGLLTFWFGLMAWTVLSLTIAIVKFNRDEVLSRIGNTVPNQFTFDRSLLAPLLTYVAAPIAGILLVWFPALGRVLFGWLGAIGAWPGV
jgi:hypothetical protein